jgi:hypothetical protein
VIAALCALLVVVVVVLRRGIVTYNVAEHRAADIVARYGSVAEDGRRVPVSFPDGTLMRAANIPRLQNWWNWLMSGNWEPSMLLVIQTVLSASPGAEYIDVGCWCGGTALYAAHFASRVYAIDADFEAIRMAASNIVVNDDALQRRIELFNVAIAPTIGTATVYGRPGSSSELTRGGRCVCVVGSSDECVRWSQAPPSTAKSGRAMTRGACRQRRSKPGHGVLAWTARTCAL